MMKNKHILLGVTGGIAAYKSAELCRQFVKSGASVQVVMSEAACEFITPLTLETLSGKPVRINMFDKEREGVEHIRLAETADLFVIAPATADFLARAAAGRASDLISAVTLAFTGPVLIAPAMNTNMWKNPATQRNLATLETEHHWHIVDPGSGDLACGWTGPGRMAEPETILAEAIALFPLDLNQRKVVVTAGPTVEDIDPVRFISNRSSGKMGYAIAEAAARRGAEVVLISGPTALPCPHGVTRIPVRAAREMQETISRHAEGSDAVFMAAAVADYRPVSMSRTKLKKAKEETERTIKLTRNPDILKDLGDRFPSPPPLLVGFALETENLLENARAKLGSKHAHIIVANLASDGFSGDDNNAIIIDDREAVNETGPISKVALANQLLDIVVNRLSG